MQIVSNIALITINETLIVQAISFLIFLFLFNRILIRPLRSVMEERQMHMERTKGDVAAAQKRVVTISLEIKAQELAAKTEAFDLCRDLEGAGSQKAADIFLQARQAIRDEREAVFSEIEKEITAARKMVQSEGESLAISVMEIILGRELN